MDLDGIHFSQMDRMVLEELRAAGGEIQVVVCREGVDDELGCALHAHCLSMADRGYLDKVETSGTRSKMQGARKWATFRARSVALALIELLERSEELERRVAAQERPSRSLRRPSLM